MKKKRQKKLFTKWIKDEVYGRSFYFVVGSREDFEKWLKKKFNLEKENQDQVYGECFDITNGENVYRVVWVLSLEPTTNDLSALMHEINHRTFSNLSEIGFKFDPNNDEPFVYYAESLFKKCLGFFYQ